MDTHAMPMTESRLTATKPTQTDLDTAARVLWWLAGHARLFPAAYGAEMGISLAPRDVLVAAANACGGDITMFCTTSEEQQEQDAQQAFGRQTSTTTHRGSTRHPAEGR